MSSVLIGRKYLRYNFLSADGSGRKEKTDGTTFSVRLDELRDDAQVPPSLLRDVVPRLEAFLQPFVDVLDTPQPDQHPALRPGVASDLKSKDVESIAYLHDQERQGLQKFIGQAEWDHRPLLTSWCGKSAPNWAKPTACWSSIPRPSPRRAPQSVGVQRQWCGRLGKIDNCQVGIYLGYVSARTRAGRCPARTCPRSGPTAQATAEESRRAGGPFASARGTNWSWRCSTSAVRHCRTPGLPATTKWAVVRGFASNCGSREECYLLAVPSNTLVRDLKAPTAPSRGRGSSPALPFVAGGPLVRGLAGDGLADGRGPRRRERAGGGAGGLDAGAGARRRPGVGQWRSGWWSSASGKATARGSTTTCCRTRRWTPPLAEFARVFKAEHRIEECLKRAKGEAGLADYQVRTGRVGIIIRRWRCWRPGS